MTCRWYCPIPIDSLICVAWDCKSVFGSWSARTLGVPWFNAKLALIYIICWYCANRRIVSCICRPQCLPFPRCPICPCRHIELCRRCLSLGFVGRFYDYCAKAQLQFKSRDPAAESGSRLPVVSKSLNESFSVAFWRAGVVADCRFDRAETLWQK